MEEGVEEITLSGFDPEGEPILRRTAAGRLWLGFDFMPPSWAPDEEVYDLMEGPWADFGDRLQAAIGVPVAWEDREWFRIDDPRPGTADEIRQFLADVRRERGPAE